MSIYRECVEEINGYPIERRKIICRNCCADLFESWRAKYGLETAKQLIWSTILIVACNDGSLKCAEHDLYDFCFGGDSGISYSEFFEDCKKYQTNSNRQFWENCCKDIYNEEDFYNLIIIMVVTATIDGDIAAREESLISSLASAIEYNFR